MKRGLIDVPLVFLGLFILAIVILLVLSFFGYNFIDKAKDVVMNALKGLAGYFFGIFKVG